MPFILLFFKKALFSNHPLNSQSDGLILAHGTIPQRVSNNSIWLRCAGLMLVQEVTIRDLQTSSLDLLLLKWQLHGNKEALFKMV